jgi:hypothetical protein
MQNTRSVLSQSPYSKGFTLAEIQKVHEQKMEKFHQSQQPRHCPPYDDNFVDSE